MRVNDLPFGIPPDPRLPPGEDTMVAHGQCIETEEETLVSALKAAFFKIVGLELASAVEDNNWQWPDTAPRHVDLTAERVRKAILSAAHGAE